jgi:Chitobiase/beta-hexosaminidase C-terminal domain/Right handed beta helix region
MHAVQPTQKTVPMNPLTHLTKSLVCCALMLLATQMVRGATYYVDSVAGNDANAGTSTAAAWRTLAKVNAVASFAPGDSILFVRGGQWSGQLAPKGSGSATLPIVIDAYGSTASPLPQLNGQGLVETTVLLKNQEYWDIKHLEITNAGTSLGALRTGIYIGAEDFGSLDHIHLIDLIIHDVNGDDASFKNITGGVCFDITGSTIPTWFNDVLIDGCYVFNCSQHGITGVYSQWTTRTLTTNTNWTPCTNVIIRNCLFEHCRRQGLIWRVTKNLLVEHNIFANCSDGAHGNAMFVFNTDDALIQMNEAYGTRFETGNPEPGQDASGFDIDFRTKRTVLQYNYSHDNGEGGIIATGGPTADVGAESFCDGSTIRYNILQNNRRAGFRLSGRMTNTHIYNNTIYISSTLPEPVDRIIEINDWSNQWPDGTNFYNNIFANYSSGASYLIGTGATNTVFDYNIFYNANGAAANQPVGSHQTSSDPLFLVGGSGGTGLDTVDGYKLKTGSPALSNGRVISTNGGRDYYGNSVSSTAAPNRGAYQGAAVSQVAAPTFSSIGGTFSGPQSVTVASATSGASIYYTLDGGTPSPIQGTLYSGAISISSTAQLQAVAVKAGLAASNVTSAPFTIPVGQTVVFEAENLVSATSGATDGNVFDSSASGGAYKGMTAIYVAGDDIHAVTNQWMEFATPSIAPGTYQLAMRFKAANTRVKVEVILDGFQVGESVDEYAASSAYQTAKLGLVKFTAAGAHKLRLVINGQNPASGGFTMTADSFTFAAPGEANMEAEDLARTVSGAAASSGSDANASGLRWVSFAADGVNDYIEFTTRNLLAGTYDLKLRYKAYNNRGIASVKVDGTVVGSVDQYASAVSWPTANIAKVTLATSGTHTVRFTLTGKNASSSSYSLTHDLITFAPPTVNLEAENLPRTSFGATTSLVTGDASASNSQLIVLNGDGVGDYVEFSTPSIAAGSYDLSLAYKGFSNRGIVQVSIDGADVGGTVDEYSAASSYPAAKVGPVAFATTGAHTIRLTVTGKNASATGYLLTADLFTFTPQ